MNIRCPVCGREFDDTLNVCPFCGHTINWGKFDVISDYEPSSATNYTTEYTVISDAFENDMDGRKKEDELIKKDMLDKDWLSYLVKWEYLKVEGDEYTLTDLGKKALVRNRAWKKKKEKTNGENHNGDG